MYHICGTLSLHYPIIKTHFPIIMKPVNCINEEKHIRNPAQESMSVNYTPQPDVHFLRILTSCHIDADNATVIGSLGMDCILQPLPWCLALVLVLAFKHTTLFRLLLCGCFEPLQCLWAVDSGQAGTVTGTVWLPFVLHHHRK